MDIMYLNKFYNAEDGTFLKAVKFVPNGDIPNNANVISSHVRYSGRKMTMGYFMLKVRAITRQDEDDICGELSSACLTFSPDGLKIVESIVYLQGWKLIIDDFKKPSVKAGLEMNDMYVKALRANKKKSSYSCPTW